MISIALTAVQHTICKQRSVNITILARRECKSLPVGITGAARLAITGIEAGYHLQVNLSERAGILNRERAHHCCTHLYRRDCLCRGPSIILH